ncbi:MAG TPA: S9 family peptidase, partial [Candidatus Dormibacteraeota bacterium]
MTSQPPFTRVQQTVDMVHGVAVPDPYRWLEEVGSPEVREWVAAQRAHTRAILDGYSSRPVLERRLASALGVGMLGPS